GDLRGRRTGVECLRRRHRIRAAHRVAVVLERLADVEAAVATLAHVDVKAAPAALAVPDQLVRRVESAEIVTHGARSAVSIIGRGRSNAMIASGKNATTIGTHSG